MSKIAYPFVLIRVSIGRDHHLELSHGVDWRRDNDRYKTKVVQSRAYYSGPKEWIDDMYEYIKSKLKKYQVIDKDMDVPIYPYNVRNELEAKFQEIIENFKNNLN